MNLRPYLFSVLLLVSSWSLATAQDSDGSLLDELSAATERAAQQTFLLRYKFAADEVVRWRVVHLATTDTRIQGTSQVSRSRSLSTKEWRVSQVSPSGEVTFSHLVADIDMWQQIGDQPEVKYNSKTDGSPPPEYVEAAKTVNVPLAKVTVKPTGQIVRRDTEPGKFDLGLGQIMIPFPETPLKIDGHWYVPREVMARLPSGQVKPIKVRQKYTLKKVEAGLATIAIETQVLTPVHDPRIEAQMVQELVNGTLKFDVTAGRVVSREINWDETVLEFSGADSMMKYRARFTEKLEPAEGRTAARSR